MRVFGIICECNPFHEGHKYILNQAREAGAEGIIAVMSGDFVQRGEPAFLSKFERTEELIDSGCDLVIELPVRYALSSAMGFADAAVRLLEATGVTDTLFFGSESGNVKALTKTAEILEKEIDFREMAELTEKGYSWPSARENVLKEKGYPEYAELLKEPNNILATEYIRALIRRGSEMRPQTVKREKSSATAHEIREAYARGDKVDEMLSEKALMSLNTGNTPNLEVWSRIALYKLRNMTMGQLSSTEDIAGGLDSRIYAAAKVSGSMEELYSSVKTKRYTMSRVKRVCSRAVLGIEESQIQPGYLRILGIGENGNQLLSEMKEKAAIPMSSSLKELSAVSRDTEQLAEEEIRATDLYNLILKTTGCAFEDLTRKLYVKKK